MSRPVAPPPPPGLMQYLEDTSNPSSSSSHAVHVAAFAGTDNGLSATAAVGATGGGRRQPPSSGSDSRRRDVQVASVASVADLTLQSACRCPHLDAVLPHILRMDRYDPIVEMHLGQHFGDVAPLTAGGKLVGSASASASASAAASARGASASAPVAPSPVGSPRAEASEAIRRNHHAHHHHQQHRPSPTKAAGPPSPLAHATAIGSVVQTHPMSPAPVSSGRSSSQQRADRSVFGPEHARLLTVTGRGGAATTWCPVLPPLYQPSGSVGSKYSSASTSSGSNGTNNDKGSKKREGPSANSAAANARSVQVSKDGAATVVSALTADVPPSTKAETTTDSAPKTAGNASPTKGGPPATKASASTPAPATMSPTTNMNAKATTSGKDSNEGPSAVPLAKPEGKEEVGAKTAAAKGEDSIGVVTAVPVPTNGVEIKDEPKTGNADATTKDEEEPSIVSAVAATAATTKDGDSMESHNGVVSAHEDTKNKPDQNESLMSIEDDNNAQKTDEIVGGITRGVEKADPGDITSDAVPSNANQPGGTDQMDVGSPRGEMSPREKLGSSDVIEPVGNKVEGGKNADPSPPPSGGKSSPLDIAPTTQSHQLPDPRYNQLRSRERRIIRERENVILKSRIMPPQEDVRLAQHKQPHRPTKRKKGEAALDGAYAPVGAPFDDGHSSYERRMLRLRASVASSKVEEWLQVVRDGREAFYNEHESNRYQRRCSWCPASVSNCKGDGLMQCLECSMIGCGPSSTSPNSSAHMMCHFIASGHNFGESDWFCVIFGTVGHCILIGFPALTLLVF